MSITKSNLNALKLRKENRMKLQLQNYDETYTVESKRNDYTANELKEMFSKMLVLDGFGPDVIELADGGRYECEYKEEV